MKKLFVFFIGLCCSCFFCSCQKTDNKRVYTEIQVLPQPSMPIFSEGTSHAETMTADPHAGLFEQSMENSGFADFNQENNTISWTAPSSWEEKRGSGLRLVTFTNPQEKDNIECSIVTLSGNAGGLKANIVRWMNQINIPIPDEPDLTQFIAQAEQLKLHDNFTGTMIDFTDLQKDALPESPSMMAAIVQTDDFVIFIKMTGTKQAVQTNRVNFRQLCQSIKR